MYGQDGKLYYASQTGGPQAASTTKYIYVGNHLLAEVDSVTGAQYVHTDALGSPIARTTAAKTVLNRSHYEPYGFIATGISGKIGFTGHVSDLDTGLTYMQRGFRSFVVCNAACSATLLSFGTCMLVSGGSRVCSSQATLRQWT